MPSGIELAWSCSLMLSSRMVTGCFCFCFELVGGLFMIGGLCSCKGLFGREGRGGASISVNRIHMGRTAVDIHAASISRLQTTPNL